ncbi:ornithine cyclodeaminase family protein [Rhodospirillum rubrum]|uniref:Ornithine cyclodeaminase n=1 Tax=Rhodospirillum rubrum (strain ATCC 11170 / ATH 1.1.1 / DSM 467 / LMG 4362 / NCIMB 8255 / S1) TaxID=269796 RepID=Q2RQD1_RHORT|nr:ornithine cyclodeaminase family protein [Rhodospirillum rubrum]ABC23664.1 ornithine cyclodeaminase [Rhodospirillum rubrum ATCC 11170]AEO49402.1 ornithine cyclodeaminase [Rhodospirillum rubrum F11]MBK5955340.1 ornithine cyclodeaminase [Rhodospirillum rubrum]QXG79624.1 ornithine cyclodeaminase family protein [Rhodospirillum rubrum]HAP98681.1 ornithine cyclodeaminase family protein [Rhodospirillum rubrum]
MRMIDADAVRRCLPWPALIDALSARFAAGCEAPVRHHHPMTLPGEPEATLLLMPAWALDGPPESRIIMVKVATVHPGNGARGLPAVAASVLAIDGGTGRPLALLDGGELTARRTAATSALAARFLARRDARVLVAVGAGRMIANLIEAHLCASPSIETIRIWARDPAKAADLCEDLADRLPFAPQVAPDLQTAVRGADIITCATLSREPLVHGAWLAEGSHLDLVGAFTPEMRESDDEAMRRATVFVDTRAGACHEGGDIVQAMSSGALTTQDIGGDLFDLVRGDHPGRTSASEITLFKSVGAAIEDLAATDLAFSLYKD